jgi:ferredoxin-NADP reductase
MRAVILNGADQSKDASDVIATDLEARYVAEGAEVRHFILRDQVVGHCQGDFDCWIRTPGRCRIKDEGQQIERAVHDADLVAMTTPIVFGGYGPHLKKATDRLIPLILPFFVRTADLTHHAHRYERLPAIAGIGIGDPQEAELFAAFVESQALNLGASGWSASVVAPDTQKANGNLPDPLPPANPSGSSDGAAARLAVEITADPVSAIYPPHPRVAVLVVSARPAGANTSLSIASYLARQFDELGSHVDIVMATEFARDPGRASIAARVLADADILAVISPLYVDALPYLGIVALREAAALRQIARPQRVMGVVNCGFPEPEHTRFAFAGLRAFARQTGAHYAGGLPVGGGEAIHGRDLVQVGGMTTPLRAALDAAAQAIAGGGVIPPDVSASLAHPVMPPALYRIVGGMGWRFRAASSGLWPGQLKARPFDTLTEAEWQAEAQTGGPGGRPLRVVGKRTETEDTVTILFEDPAHDPLTYTAGQYITLDVAIGGTRVRRAYSLASTPDEPGLAITVKRVPGGVMSNHLHDALAIGDILRSHGPSGNFGIVDPAARQVLLIAGGSGIVPLAAIARTVLRTNPKAQVKLVYGASSLARAIYSDMLEAMVQTEGGRFALHWVLEQPEPGHDASKGRVDEGGCGALLTTLDPTRQDAVLICGPDGMRASARAMLAARGVDMARVQEESFVSPRPAAGSDKPEQAIVVSNGKETTFKVLPGQSLLDAALDAGQFIDFSCLCGGCGSCAITILDGLSHMALDAPNTVSASASAQGIVPACITRINGTVRFRVGRPLPDDPLPASG